MPALALMVGRDRAPSAESSVNAARMSATGESSMHSWRRCRWELTLEYVLSDIALPVIDVPVRVADVVVPNHRVHTKIAGLHRRIPRTPMTWTGGVVFRAPGPRTPHRHRCVGKGLCASDQPAR